MNNIKSIAKLAEVMPASMMPPEFSVRLKSNGKQFAVTLPKSFHEKYMECDYDKKLKTLHVALVPLLKGANKNTQNAVKVGKSQVGNGPEYYKAIFSASKWVQGMPDIALTLRVKWDTKLSGFSVDLSEHIDKKAPTEVRHIEVKQDNVDDHNKMSKGQAAKCLQYLNKFRLSSHGEGYQFDIMSNGTLRMKKEDIIE